MAVASTLILSSGSELQPLPVLTFVLKSKMRLCPLLSPPPQQSKFTTGTVSCPLSSAVNFMPANSFVQGVLAITVFLVWFWCGKCTQILFSSSRIPSKPCNLKRRKSRTMNFQGARKTQRQIWVCLKQTTPRGISGNCICLN